MTSPMTPLEAFERLPWTWFGPIEVRDEYGVHFEMRIAELPGFFVAGTTAQEVQNEREEALRAFLASYVGRDAVPPIRPTWVMVLHGSEPPPSAEENAGFPALRLSRAAG